MTHFEIGDIVKPTTKNILGGSKPIPEGISVHKMYEITGIDRALDGAYSWDDLYLKGFRSRKFCEFDFEPIKQNNHQRS